MAALTASLSARITVTSAASTSFRSGQFAITLPRTSVRARERHAPLGTNRHLMLWLSPFWCNVSVLFERIAVFGQIDAVIVVIEAFSRSFGVMY